MIKRRFYRYEHGDKDVPSESSDSDSEVEAQATDETEDEEDNAVGAVGQDGTNSSSGYESEDSSANEVNLDSSGVPTSDDDLAVQNEGNPILAKTQNRPEKDEIRFDETNFVLKCRSVFKCRICPRIVCLSEETLKAHLNSKRHARSEKLLGEGRLKLMLNEKGQIEGDTYWEKQDTDSEEESPKSKKKGKCRRKQKKRMKQEKGEEKAGGSPNNRKKRRRNLQLKKNGNHEVDSD